MSEFRLTRRHRAENLAAPNLLQAFSTQQSGENVRYRKGERVVALREFQGMNRPTVPMGAEGEVVETTLLTGRPKTVLFHLTTEWGPKTFTTYVERGDIGRPD